jgi:hypothetical protein
MISARVTFCTSSTCPIRFPTDTQTVSFRFLIIARFAMEVRPKQTIRKYFQPNKMARAFEKGCIVAKRGQ